ncbi:CUN005 putative bro protein, similar to AcMNPV ORF2 [Culex nigripalpus nucleopolyhedrovirus]|uniref:CUN005 putative bro protein, similar to AcMNPV ORF2 n=2 Tax=Deltabaculovirus TaxID=558019 RepID=Q919R0_NPVCO|nr:CUN005 putative bro protein, similar to AcMNPV ORF2 [Culex nigripalpus nucleopolyhedrovirus]AAK94083.1 CUN005 putative bro protein, similar to AcMNPV ORF2 [Culex nigripalpus nucleopolyhedrovirus]
MACNDLELKFQVWTVVGYGGAELVLQFYHFTEPTSGKVYVSGRTVSAGLGFKDPTASMCRKVSSRNRIQWKVLAAGLCVKLPINWKMETTMINRDGLRQLAATKEGIWPQLSKLWNETFDCNFFEDDNIIEVECDVGSSVFQLQNWDVDDKSVVLRLYIHPITNEPWVVAADLARCLGYEKYRQTHTRILAAFKRKLSDLVHTEPFSGTVESEVARLEGAPVELSSRERDIVVVNEGGIHQMLIGSRLPNVQKYKELVFGKILPAARARGELQIGTIGQGDGGAVEPTNQLQSNEKILELELALSRSNSELKVVKLEQLRVQESYESKLKITDMEHRRMKLECKLKLIELAMGIGKRDQLIADTYRDIQEICEGLSPHIVPEVPSCKLNYIALYERAVGEGKRVVRVCRIQRDTLDKWDRMMERQDTVAPVGPEDQNFWLVNSKPGPRIRCSSATAVWNRCKITCGRQFYGMTHWGNTHNELVALTRAELKAKFLHQKKYNSGELYSAQLNHIREEDVHLVENLCLVADNKLMDTLNQMIVACLDETSKGVHNRLKRRLVSDYKDSYDLVDPRLVPEITL